MRKAIILIVLGSLGILQYIYFQFTPLAYNYEGVVTETDIFGHEIITEVIWTRDWTAGIVGALIGIILLFFGVGYFRSRKATDPAQNIPLESSSHPKKST